MSQELTPQCIKDILEKSGYLFEQRVASVIEELGFWSTTNRAYLDDDESKSREIDVVAHKKIWELKVGATYHGICYLNCECKNSTTPFVFIKRKRGELEKYYIPDGMNFIHNNYYKHSENGTMTINAFSYLGLESLHYATRENSHAVQICKIIQNGSKKEAQHSGIIEGLLYPLIKSYTIWKAQTPKNNDQNAYCKLAPSH